jgi:hypothetical protein
MPDFMPTASLRSSAASGFSSIGPPPSLIAPRSSIPIVEKLLTAHSTTTGVAQMGSQLNGLESGSVHLQTRQLEPHSIAVSAAAKTFKTAHKVSKQSAARSPKHHGIKREIARDSQPEDPTIS